MLTDADLDAPLGAEEATLAGGLLAAHGAERVAAAYGRLWSAARPLPEALTPVRARRRRRAAGLWFAVGLAPDEPEDSRALMRRLCRLGRVSRQEIRRMRILETEVLVEVGRAAAWGFLAAAADGAARRLPGPLAVG